TASGFEGRALGNDLADQADLLGLGDVKAAPGEQKVTDDGVPEIPLEPRNPAKTGNDSKTQFWKAEASRLVGDDQVAGEGQLKAASEHNSVHTGNGGQGGCVEDVHGA